MSCHGSTSSRPCTRPPCSVERLSSCGATGAPQVDGQQVLPVAPPIDPRAPQPVFYVAISGETRRVASSGPQRMRHAPVLLRRIVSMAPLLLRATNAFQRRAVERLYPRALVEILHVPRMALHLRPTLGKDGLPGRVRALLYRPIERAGSTGVTTTPDLRSVTKQWNRKAQRSLGRVQRYQW